MEFIDLPAITLSLKIPDLLLNFVTGKHEERDTDSKKVTIRQFQRMYTLPEGVTKEDVVSNLSADGVLVVTAKKGAAKQ